MKKQKNSTSVIENYLQLVREEIKTGKDANGIGGGGEAEIRRDGLEQLELPFA